MPNFLGVADYQKIRLVDIGMPNRFPRPIIFSLLRVRSMWIPNGLLRVTENQFVQKDLQQMKIRKTL